MLKYQIQIQKLANAIAKLIWIQSLLSTPYTSAWQLISDISYRQPYILCSSKEYWNWFLFCSRVSGSSSASYVIHLSNNQLANTFTKGLVS